MKKLSCTLMFLFATNVFFLNASEKKESSKCFLTVEEVDCVKWAHDKMGDEMEEFVFETPEEYTEGFNYWVDHCEREFNGGSF